MTYKKPKRRAKDSVFTNEECTLDLKVKIIYDSKSGDIIVNQTQLDTLSCRIYFGISQNRDSDIRQNDSEITFVRMTVR